MKTTNTAVTMKTTNTAVTMETTNTAVTMETSNIAICTALLLGVLCLQVLVVPVLYLLVCSLSAVRQGETAPATQCDANHAAREVAQGRRLPCTHSLQVVLYEAPLSRLVPEHHERLLQGRRQRHVRLQVKPRLHRP